MADVGELLVRIKADASQLQQEMSKASGAVKQQTSQMESAIGSLKDQFKELIPAITLASLVEFSKSIIEAVSHIGDLALRTGFAATTLSALEPALKTSGSNLDEFSASINRMNNLIGEAAKGTNQEAVKAFDALGLSVRKLQELSPEEQFYQIAKALGEIDDQSKFTNAGIAIFGRSFAALAPLIKEANGNIEEHVRLLGKTTDALGPETITRIKAFGDSMETMWLKVRNNAAEALAAVLKFSDTLAEKSGIDFSNPEFGSPMPNRVSTTRPKTVDEATFYGQDYYQNEPLYPMQLDIQNSSAKGDNSDLLRPKSSALTEYIANLKQETGAIGENEKALFVARAEIEASAKAKDDWNNHLRDSKTLTGDEKANIDQLAESYYDLKQAQEENARVAKIMQDALAESLADIAINFNNLKDTATGAIQAIGKEIIKAKITEPLSKSIIGALPSFSGLGSFFGGFFADGGDPPVGVPSVVGENGPELFVPNQSGTIIPNSQMGGGTITVYQTFNMQPGLAETVGAAIRQAAPQIAAMTHGSIAQDIQNGGPLSRIVAQIVTAINLPLTPNFTTCRFGLETNTQTFTSPLTKTTQRVKLGGARWNGTYSLPAMTRAQAANWKAFFLLLEGGANTFNAFDPDCKVARGVVTGNPVVNGGSQTGSSLVIDGCTHSVTNWALPGDYFSVNGELKMITAPVTTDSSGNATLTFKPALRTSPTDNAVVTFDQPTCTMVLADDLQAMWECNAQGVYQPKSFNAYEVFT